MAQVTIEINGRSHVVGCGDGEEDRLRALSKYIDTKVRELAGQVGAVGEARLLLLTCLMLADELGEAYQDAEARRAASEGIEASAREAELRAGDLQARIAEIEATLARRDDVMTRDLDRIAQRLSAVAERLAPGS
jgi:cell division protein ZapA